MKKDYYVKIKKKQIRKKLRSESGRRKSPVFFVPKVIRQKFAFLEVSSIIKIETKKREYKKQKCKRSCRGSNPQFSFIGATLLLNFRPFFVWQDRWL